MSSTKIEFLVQMTCESCVKAVRQNLQGSQDVKNVEVDLSSGRVVVDTSLPADSVLKMLQNSGRKAVLKGYGSMAGVAILDAGQKGVQGVIRFVQESPGVCVVDGTVDGLKPGKHRLDVHECGDISKGCESCGDYFNPDKVNGIERVYGNLGDVEATSNGRAVFKFDDSVIKLSDIIGRSLVISEVGSAAKVACGIIARSAGLFQNPKTICACDGVSIWDEKEPPKPRI